ncbi:MAG: hypothetical protein K2H70_01480, partial [Bacteroidales bacterium]|nr:hypothetical protein [Bacteroidales bacterium]
MNKKAGNLRNLSFCVLVAWGFMASAGASTPKCPADTVAAYCGTLRVALDSAGQARVERAIDAAVDAAVDSAVVKAVGESKAHKFFSDLWNQFGFGIDARVDFQLVQNRAGEHDVQFN